MEVCACACAWVYEDIFCKTCSIIIVVPQLFSFFLHHRYLILYQYGGIYTDIDAAPGPKFENATIINDDDDAWFVVERIGIPSQYFMAASPRHPFMHLLVTVTLRRLMEVQNVGLQYVPFVTGPGALKEAWMHFTYSYPNEGEEGSAADDSMPEDDIEDGGKINVPGDPADEESPEQRRRLLEVNYLMRETQFNNSAILSHVEKKAAELREAEEKKKRTRKFGLEGGVYFGMFNRTVTIAGSRRVRDTAALKVARARPVFNFAKLRHFLILSYRS